MATWFDGATVTVEVAFTNNPLTANASCTWVDVSTYVRDLAIKRGRTTELSDYFGGLQRDRHCIEKRPPVYKDA